MIGYMILDWKMTEGGKTQYRPGNIYKTSRPIKLRGYGFHFYADITACFGYNHRSGTRFAKVEALGKVVRSVNGIGCVTDRILILEEIPRRDAVKMTNSGKNNSGAWNTGNYNSGDGNSGSYNPGNYNSGAKNTGIRNSGDCNAGSCNSGYRNTGAYNSGSCNTHHGNSGNRNTGNGNRGHRNAGDWNLSSGNTGCFMTVEPTLMMFNKPSDWTYDKWSRSGARSVMRGCPPEKPLPEWVRFDKMTEEEKKMHPEYKKTRGYLKTDPCTESRQEWWDSLPAHSKRSVMRLPNFDPDVFYECTGIRV